MLFARRRQKAEVERRIAQAKASEDRVFANQERLRQNIQSMEKVQNCGTLMSRYLTDLNKDEDDLIKTREQIAALEEESVKHKESVGQHEILIAGRAQKLLE